MFKNKQKQINSLSNLNLKDEYKGLSKMALIYATRYCLHHKKEILTDEDVKKYFNDGLAKYTAQKQNKLIKEDNNA